MGRTSLPGHAIHRLLPGETVPVLATYHGNVRVQVNGSRAGCRFWPRDGMMHCSGGEPGRPD